MSRHGSFANFGIKKCTSNLMILLEFSISNTHARGYGTTFQIHRASRSILLKTDDFRIASGRTRIPLEQVGGLLRGYRLTRQIVRGGYLVAICSFGQAAMRSPTALHLT